MQISDGGMAMNMNAQHHMEHFDNVLNLNMNNEYHYGMEYWNGSYKNGSTPMKEMEGENYNLCISQVMNETACSICEFTTKECSATSHLSTSRLTPSVNATLCAIPDSVRDNNFYF